MTDRRPPVDPVEGFLDELVEDLFSLSDEELRAELREAGESLDDYSERFQTALRAVDGRQLRSVSDEQLREELRALGKSRDDSSRRTERPSRVAEPGWPLVLPANRERPIAARAVAEPAGPSGRVPGVKGIRDPHGESKWGTRPVRRYAGEIGALLDLVPEFETAPFRASATMEDHPDRMLVVRRPLGDLPEMAVGAVSAKYSLVQHRDAVRMCLRGLERAGLDADELRGELALSEFGEWMGFTFVLPPHYAFRDTYDHDVQFHCDVANSVDGSSRLSVWFDWFRPVCSNGMVVREGRREARMHRSGLQLHDVEQRIFEGFAAAERDRETLEDWQRTATSWRGLKGWVDNDLRRAWHDHAAARVCHICLSGEDTDRFRRDASCSPSARAIGQLQTFDDESRPVPGSPHQASTKYDVAQAMSWVASRKTSVVERVRWQRQIPALLDRLQAA